MGILAKIIALVQWLLYLIILPVWPEIVMISIMLHYNCDVNLYSTPIGESNQIHWRLHNMFCWNTNSDIIQSVIYASNKIEL